MRYYIDIDEQISKVKGFDISLDEIETMQFWEDEILLFQIQFDQELCIERWGHFIVRQVQSGIIKLKIDDKHRKDRYPLPFKKIGPTAKTIAKRLMIKYGEMHLYLNTDFNQGEYVFSRYVATQDADGIITIYLGERAKLQN